MDTREAFPDPKPPLWAEFESVASGGPGPAYFGFDIDWPTIRRFQARYQLTHVCKGLKTGGYGDATAQGYDALTRTFLSWSLFEVFRKIAAIIG